MVKKKNLTLVLILGFYSALYIATSYSTNAVCDADCERVRNIDDSVRNNRSYVWYVSRCQNRTALDTLCVYVRDSAGINWSLLADTVCMISTHFALPQQKIFLIRSRNNGFDTVVTRTCP